MSLEKLFESAVAELSAGDVDFAVAGGFAAELYRNQPRVTNDVDLSIVAGSGEERIAASILKKLCLKVGRARQADLAGGPMFAIKSKKSPVCIVVGRTESQDEGVDFLLPALPWVPEAVRRAQSNEVDFGFGLVPVLTVEDVILSKLYALNGAKIRAKDIDDLQSITEAGHEMNEAYLTGRIQALEMKIPRNARPLLPKEILSLFR